MINSFCNKNFPKHYKRHSGKMQCQRVEICNKNLKILLVPFSQITGYTVQACMLRYIMSTRI